MSAVLRARLATSASWARVASSWLPKIRIGGRYCALRNAFDKRLRGFAQEASCSPSVKGSPREAVGTRLVGKRIGTIAEPLAGDHVLVDGDSAEEAEALLVAGGHDDGIAGAGAAEEVAGEDGGAESPPAVGTSIMRASGPPAAVMKRL